MSVRNLLSQSSLDHQLVNRRASSARPSGHAHFWQRAAFSRRRFLGGVAGLGAGLALPAIARPSSNVLAKPIPGGLDLLGNGEIFHVYLPGTAPELSTITDFNGVLGATEILGSWSGGGVTAPPDTPLVFDADVRFMAGEYIGRDGGNHQGTFAFV